MFYFAFSSIEEADAFHSIPTAVVRDGGLNEAVFLERMLEALGNGEEAVLKLQWVSDEEEADELLKEEEIRGYIVVEEGTPKLYVKEQGIYQTILKNILDRYIQTADTVETIISENPEGARALAGEAMKFFEESQTEDEQLFTGELIEELKLTSQRLSATFSYYYALLAMLCMYGGFHGLVVIEGLQANLSPQGARNTMSPGNQYKLFCGSYLGALTIQFFCVVVAICYMRFVLKVDFGSRLGYVFGAGFAGSMLGIAFGSLVGLPSKWKAGVKNGIMIGISIICCFFAGLMIGGINYLVDRAIPDFASDVSKSRRDDGRRNGRGSRGFDAERNGGRGEKLYRQCCGFRKYPSVSEIFALCDVVVMHFRRECGASVFPEAGDSDAQSVQSCKAVFDCHSEISVCLCGRCGSLGDFESHGRRCVYERLFRSGYENLCALSGKQFLYDIDGDFTGSALQHDYHR